MKKLENLNFSNTAIRTLPLDPITENYPRKVPACFSLVNPTPVKNPQLIHYSQEALQLLNLSLTEVKRPEFPYYLSGSQLLPGSQPAAHCYCGHQFGSFAGQLGDGRAIYLGEIFNNKGERWELQLKGSGKTPYSRDGDGRAVLRSSIREFLCSEAMYHLGIPTTRAGTLVTSDTYVERDIKYNGQKTLEKATIISRIAPTFIRFGSFQIADPIDMETGQMGSSPDNKELIKQLANYVIKYHYPHIFNSYTSLERRIVAFAEELTLKTAQMVALWQSYGFTHGVLNTDNMSIIGITLDYGPFGFLDAYDPDYVPNGSDKEGRYRFINQPGICKWNLEKLFQSIGHCFPQIQLQLNKIVEKFCHKYKTLYFDQMRRKLGLFQSFQEDELLIESLLETMQHTSGDFTNIFRSFSQVQLFGIDIEKQKVLEYILQQTQKKSPKNRSLWISWLKLYKDRIERELTGNNNSLSAELSARIYIMNHNNPKYILRNYLAQMAIEKAEQGDYSEIKKLLDVLRDPFDDLGHYGSSGYDRIPPEWSTKLTLTCSS